MKTKIFTAFLLLILMGAVSFAVYPINRTNVSNPRLLADLLRDRIGTLDDEVTTLQALATGGVYNNIGTGDVFYVDSATGSDGDTGVTWALAKATLDAAVGLCADNNGDVIYIAQNHSETLGTSTDGVDCDKAGITIIGLGNGDDRPLFDYDTTTDEFAIGAIGVTIYNLTFKPNINNVALAIDVENGGDGAVIWNCEFLEGETAGTDEFIDCIQIGTTATDVLVYGCKYTCSGTNANTFVDLTAATIARPWVVGNVIYGSFLEAPVYWGSAVPTLCYIAHNTITNIDVDQHCIEGTGNGTGMIAHNTLKCGDLDTCIDPGYMACIENYATTGTADTSAVLVPLAEIRDISGDVWYLDSVVGADAVTHGRSWAQSFATLNYAVAACASDNGDIIYVAPGHTEALTTSAVTLNVDGIKIIGLGVGSDRPTITFAHADSSIVISADDLMIKNFVFSSITATTDETIDITGPGVVLEGCTWIETGDFEHTISVTLDAAAENSTIRNCTFYGAGTGATSAISIVGGVIDHLVIEGCRIWGDFDDAGIYSDQVNTNALIKDCVISNRQTTDHAIELSGAMTGEIVNCMLFADTPGSVLDPGSMKCFGNLEVTAIDTGAVDVPRVLGRVYYSTDTTGAMSSNYDTTDSPVDLFTITGTILARLTAVCDTAVTSAGGAGTIAVGVVGDTAALLVSDAVDGTAFDTDFCWSSAQAPDTTSAEAGEWVLIPNGADIEMVISGANCSAGVITFYLQWIPLTSDAKVVPTAP